MSNGIYEIQGTVSNQYPLVGGTYILTIPGGYGPGEAIGESIVYGKYGTTIFTREGSPYSADVVLSKNQPGLYYYAFIAGYVGTVTPDYPVSKQIPVWVLSADALKQVTFQVQPEYKYVGYDYYNAYVVITGYVYYLNSPVSAPLELKAFKTIEDCYWGTAIYQTSGQSDSTGFFRFAIRPQDVQNRYLVYIRIDAKGQFYGSVITKAVWYSWQPYINLSLATIDMQYQFFATSNSRSAMYLRGSNLDSGQYVDFGQMIFDGVRGTYYQYISKSDTRLIQGLWEFRAWTQGTPGGEAPAISNAVYLTIGKLKSKIEFNVVPGTAIIGGRDATVTCWVLDYSGATINYPLNLRIKVNSLLNNSMANYSFTSNPATIMVPSYFGDALVEAWAEPTSTYSTFEPSYSSVRITWYSTYSTLTISGPATWCSIADYPLTITLSPSPSQTATIEIYENDGFIRYAYIGSGQTQTIFQVPAKAIVSGSVTYTYQAKFKGIPGNLAPSTSNKLSVIYYAPTQLTLTSSAYSVLVGSNFTLTGSANPRFSGQARIYQYFNGTTTMVGSWNTTGTTVSLTLNRSTPGSYYYYLQDLYNNDLRGQSDTIEVKVGVIPKITIWDSGIAIGSTTIFGVVNF